MLTHISVPSFSKKFLLFAYAFILLTQLPSCKKEQTVNTPTIEQLDFASSIQTIQTVNLFSGYKASDPITLTVTMNTNRSLKKGQTFIHTLKVVQGTQPLSGYYVGIDDPIKKFCTQIKTNSQGIVEYRSIIPQSIQADFYQYRFFITNATPVVSGVSVYDDKNGTNLPNVKVNVSSVLQTNISASSMCFSERAANIGQTTSNSVASLNSTFGKDFMTEILGNWYGAGVITVAAISCPLTFVVPPAGVLCAATARAAVTTLSIAAAKVIAKRAVDRSSLSTTDKKLAKDFIDLSGLVYGVATFKLDESLTSLEVNENRITAWDFGNVIAQLSHNSSGKVNGYYLTGEIKGTNGEMCVMASYKK